MNSKFCVLWLNFRRLVRNDKVGVGQLLTREVHTIVEIVGSKNKSLFWFLKIFQDITQILLLGEEYALWNWETLRRGGQDFQDLSWSS